MALAVVTGASSGIGFELAKCCAGDGYDLIVCADEPEIESAAEDLRKMGTSVEAVQCDLGTEAGVETLWQAIDGRPIDALIANAGRGLGHAFLDQDLGEAKTVVDVNILGTISLIQKVGRQMRDRNEGRILINGSIAGYMPGAFQLVYNASKAFIDNFSYGLRNELKDTDVTVTCLMPGPTETEFFKRAGMEDTPVGESEKADPAKVAADGYKAMMNGDAGVASGLKNKLQVAFAGVLPDTVLAQMHRSMAEPGRQRR